MSISIIHESKPIARKNYSCDACIFLFDLNIPKELGLSFSEYRAVVKAKQNGYKILKGERYIRQFNTDNCGNTWTFRGIPEITKICHKHNLFDEDA